MTLDIRYPIGWLFGLIGAMLIGEGCFGGAAPVAAAAGLNIDLWWGLVMGLFGAGMLFFARRGDLRCGDAG